MKEKILERFLKYVRIDTQSDDNSETFPSTAKQFDLAKVLYAELQGSGLSGVSLDDNGYIMATLPSNMDKAVPVIGFISHMDTSGDTSGKDVNPQLHPDYDGGDILLNKDLEMVLSPKVSPEMKHYIGHTLITTDGTTLLGSDDKSGIAEIMSAMEYLTGHPEIKHGTIKIAFTPDEEIGRGVDFFDVKKYGADFAYTMDAGGIGELEYENFNAALAKLTVHGKSIHTGYAKGKLINSLHVAIELNALLPVSQRPEYTEGYEGFFHLLKMEGTMESTKFQYLIRDHDRAKFDRRKAMVQEAVDFINARYGEKTVELELKDQYFNMREMVEPQYHIIATAIHAMELVGVKPVVVPIRGGTDGARLSYMGLPCPNLFAGMINFHGRMEFVSLETMVKATEVILKIIELYSNPGWKPPLVPDNQ